MQSFKSILPARATRRFAGAAVFAAALTLAAAPAHAQDKAILDLLVKRGVITQAEADDAAKSEAVIVTPKEAAVKKLQLEGMLQVQYDWLTTQDKSLPAKTIQPPSTNQFQIRRAYLGAIADLGNGWGGEILFDFAAGPQTSAAPQAQSTQNNFEKLIITKKFGDYGSAIFGFQKVNWDQEENTPSSQLKTVERSIATNYFDSPWGGSTTGRLGFGNRHTGVFWNGLVPSINGFYYGFALTNGIQSTTNFGNTAAGTANYNEFAGWANLGYSGKWGNFGYKFGVNAGYAGDANSVSGLPLLLGYNQNNAIFGYNPYATFTYDNFALAVEFLQAKVQNGRVSGPTAATSIYSDAAPYGINVTPSYKINSQWEIAAKYSLLATNGRGTTINPVDRNAQNTFIIPGQVPANTASNFDNAWSAYLGVNYYFIGYNVKVSAGYEFTQFTSRQTITGGNWNGARADVNGFRTQLQVVF